MARRDQPYIPLYVDDFLSDEKLSLCGAESTGVYIRLMCLMHKSDEYGVILLKQKFKQTSKQINNFACLLSKQMPYQEEVIERSLQELIDEGVIILDGERLMQKRMVKDGKISDSKALSGKKGGKKTQSKRIKNDSDSENFASDFAKAKSEANSVIGIVVVNDNKTDTDVLEETIKPNARTYEQNAGIAIAAYMDKVSGGPPSPMVAEAIREYAKEMDAEAIIRAFDIAIAERTFKWSYIDGILRQFKADGVRTVEDVIRRDAEYKEKKAKREGRKDARSNGDDRSDSKSDRKLDGATYL